jgi:hypothetical protein
MADKIYTSKKLPVTKREVFIFKQKQPFVKAVFDGASL